GRAARGGDRAEPRARRRGRAARVHDRLALPDAFVPGPVGHSGVEDHGQRPRRRRALRARALARRMSVLLANAHVVTMDDVGSEHADGWILIAGGSIEAVGGGTPPAADERHDLDGAVLTPGLVNTHHHLYQTLT